MMNFNRNHFFIPKELQQKLLNTTVLLCGVGMGSVIAENLVRTGIGNIIIADGDTIENSNLNRQNFTLAEVGEMKVTALEGRLKSINPTIHLEVISTFLDEKMLDEWIPNADFVINSIDFDSPVFLACHQIAKKHEKIELFPINLGFGGGLIVNNKNTPEWGSFYKTENALALKGLLLNHICQSTELSNFSIQKFEEYKTAPPEHDPQLHNASIVCSSLVLSSIISLLKGEKVKVFPETIVFDPLLLIGN
ncbi:ThiF family adenylyltransferase [Flammeovirga sp. EKP202]|uniref:HesA/MoeB/ThiF family protein n=1 Tax=Flammeovirga sp. EKP202 TaxID=2770592 RepID=UPI00165F4B97|nr:ThiF family adenylyltransferase [Flammeovirga sp. EKP202]MBD0403521.1 ThiF family adenylyltransferase [Flammeovirga sp. EKP202]